jgi:hypothetical protein
MGVSDNGAMTEFYGKAMGAKLAPRRLFAGFPNLRVRVATHIQLWTLSCPSVMNSYRRVQHFSGELDCAFSLQNQLNVLDLGRVANGNQL